MACADCPLTKKQPKGDLQRLLEFSTMSYGCTTHLRNRYLDTREYNRNNYPSARGVTCAGAVHFFAQGREVIEYRKNKQERSESMKAKKNKRERSPQMRAS
jgi:hypothetical protein